MKYRGKTHNSILTEYGVFNSLCINLGRGKFSLLQSAKRKIPFLTESKMYLYQHVALQFNYSKNMSYELSTWNASLVVPIFFCKHFTSPCCLASKTLKIRVITLFSSRSFSLPILDTFKTSLYQLGDRLGGLDLVFCLK